MRKSIFRTNDTYHNYLRESSHLENASTWKGWWSGIGMASTCEKSTREIAPIMTVPHW